MNATLLNKTELKITELDLETLDPSYRKATVNMALACLACENLLKLHPEIPRGDISFILATHFGEVHSTLEFLKTYHETQVPRPILFQNSLHNSTLGFTSIQLGLTGPAMTVSADAETEKATYELADSLFELSPYVLVCFVDYVPESLMAYYEQSFPFIKKYLNQASSFLYSRPAEKSR